MPKPKERMWAIDKITRNPRNARKHPKREIAILKESLQEHGQVEPLLLQIPSGMLIGGHARLEAMTELGWSKIWVVELEIADLKAQALAIALNRSAELGKWDKDILAGLLSELDDQNFDLSSMGWSDKETSKLLSRINDGDDLPEELEPTKVREGSPLRMSKEERAFFEQAMAEVRKLEEGASEGRCLRLISEQFLRELKAAA